MTYEYVEHRWPSDEQGAADNLTKILGEELGMQRVKSRSELEDGKFVIVTMPHHLLLIVTLDDRPFTCLLVNRIRDDEDARKGVFGDVDVSVNQLRRAARAPGRERLTFGDKVWRENKAKHGIEVSFETRPSDQILAFLKRVGFHYGKSGIWWAKDTPEIRKAVADMGLSERPAA